MNKPRTDIIDITKIKRPVLVWWKVCGFEPDIEIVYPNGFREQYYEEFSTWVKTMANQYSFEFYLVAWQYI